MTQTDTEQGQRSPKYRESFTIDEVLVKYQELQAHVERLADALRQAIHEYGVLTDFEDAYERKDWTQALAQWERVQK